jgi:hypothetical protein
MTLAPPVPQSLRLIQWADFRGPFEDTLRSLLDGIGYLQESLPLAAPKAKSKGYVFISYANEDAEFVADLKVFLKDRATLIGTGGRANGTTKQTTP